MNEQGDHQMETYFNNTSGNNNGGMFCENERTGPKMQKAFRKINSIYKSSFKSIGGEYVKQDHEATCAIRLPRTLFFGVGAVKDACVCRVSPFAMLRVNPTG